MTGEQGRILPLIQGEFRISDRPNDVITTILGSCIATCLHDPVARIGGANHFLVPGCDSDHGEELRFGINAMELLINSLIRRGAEKSRLTAKVFGGARMTAKGNNIGLSNAEFAIWFLDNEGIACVSRSIGGTRGRKLKFWPESGRVSQMFMTDRAAETVLPEVVPKPAPRPAASGSGDVTFL